MSNDANNNPVNVQDNQSTKEANVKVLMRALWSISENGEQQKVRISNNKKSINCFNPIAGFNMQHITKLAITAGFSSVMFQEAGRKYKDKDTGEEKISDSDMLTITTDATALTPVNEEDAIAQVCELLG